MPARISPACRPRAGPGTRRPEPALRHHVSKILPYTAEQLFALVADIDAYPQFVPWIVSMRTWNVRQLAEGLDTVDAEAGVGFAFLKERFSTRVRRDSRARTLQVALISGPFRKLENRWSFHDDPAGARVEFDIDFTFKSRLLEALLAANFHHAVDRLMACFEARAKALYGAPPVMSSDP
jgi:coenzyme Q-binding protein COQ10